MVVSYLDASAAVKLFATEAESDSLRAWLRHSPDRELTSSWLLYTELCCALERRPGVIPEAELDEFIDSVNLVDVTRPDLMGAPGARPLRSNDAIHLVVALRLGVDEFITYDIELIEAAGRFGVRVLSPGRD